MEIHVHIFPPFIIFQVYSYYFIKYTLLLRIRLQFQTQLSITSQIGSHIEYSIPTSDNILVLFTLKFE